LPDFSQSSPHNLNTPSLTLLVLTFLARVGLGIVKEMGKVENCFQKGFDESDTLPSQDLLFNLRSETNNLSRIYPGKPRL
jgi:hypothetical protein